jgi:hypothetical protein
MMEITYTPTFELFDLYQNVLKFSVAESKYDFRVEAVGKPQSMNPTSGRCWVHAANQPTEVI